MFSSDRNDDHVKVISVRATRVVTWHVFVKGGFGGGHRHEVSSYGFEMGGVEVISCGVIMIWFSMPGAAGRGVR